MADRRLNQRFQKSKGFCRVGQECLDTAGIDIIVNLLYIVEVWFGQA
jgi:hypothetical protein